MILFKVYASLFCKRKREQMITRNKRLIVFVQKTALSVTVCSVKFAQSLQEFMVISIASFMEAAQ